MAISTYHIHNVLRTYSRQLSKEKQRCHNNVACRGIGADWISVSARARREAVIDKVTSDIVNRIIRRGPREDMEPGICRKIKAQRGNGGSAKEEDPKMFFKLTDKEKGEVKKTISIEDSRSPKAQSEKSAVGKAHNEMIARDTGIYS